MISYIVLVPPILVITCAFITKKVIPSLLLGIVTAACIVAHGSIINTITIIANTFWKQADSANLYTFGYLFILGIIIALMNQTGATTYYSSIIGKKIKNKKSAETASILLSLCFMIDDFFSSITVGCIMRPLTDHFYIARAKLAFLIDSLAAPLVILIPVSSWIAMIIAQLENAGISVGHTSLINADPFSTYVHTIPFIFYSFINLVSVIFIVRARISYGPMYKQEYVAQKTHNLWGGKEPIKNIQQDSSTNSSLWDFLLPILSLIITVFLSMLHAGDYYLFGGTNTMLQALSQPNIIFSSLFRGGVITLIISLIWYFTRKKITISNIPTVLKEAQELMVGSMLVLLLAWTFSSLLTNDLKTGDFLAQLLLGTNSSIWLPALFFVLAMITSISIGSSWGTIAVLVPLAVPMVTALSGLPTPIALDHAPLLLPLLGSIFAGAVTGDHISPIAGTTVMSSTSAGSYHTDHVQTQLVYAVPVIIGTIISFLVSGFLYHSTILFNVIISLTAGLTICFLAHMVLLFSYKQFIKNLKKQEHYD